MSKKANNEMMSFNVFLFLNNHDLFPLTKTHCVQNITHIKRKVIYANKEGNIWDKYKDVTTTENLSYIAKVYSH